MSASGHEDRPPAQSATIKVVSSADNPTPVVQSNSRSSTIMEEPAPQAKAVSAEVVFGSVATSRPDDVSYRQVGVLIPRAIRSRPSGLRSM